jgi:uncharacterized protein YecE (DUF72 family)
VTESESPRPLPQSLHPSIPIRIGTSGFSFDDWLGRAYPLGLAKAKMLEHYESVLGFDTVELNFTYYAMPTPKTLASMVSRTGAGFCFVVRSHRDMTHDIWADEDRRVLKETGDVFRAFRAGISPLVDSGRLGCVLVQLPVFFYPAPQNYEYLLKMPALMPGVSIVVEFRNRAWLRPDAFRLLEQSGMGCCVVDEPKLSRLMPFEPRRTSDIGYFRFHGRNQNWFKASREERYNYLYSKAELDEFIPPLRSVSAGAKTTFVFFNNCHAGAAARNALMMKQMLGLIDTLTPEQTRVVEGEPAPR